MMPTERGNKTVEDVRDDLLSKLSGVKHEGGSWWASCPVPGHGQGLGDRDPSLKIDEADDRVLIHCFGNCDKEQIVESIGWTLADLFPSNNGKVVPFKKPIRQEGGEGQEAPAPKKRRRGENVLLSDYAEYKQIPATFLQELGLSDNKYGGLQRVQMPYFDEDGVEVGVSYRTALEKVPDGPDERFWRPPKSKLPLYGLQRLGRIKEAGYVVLVEGESDVHTLLYNNVQALGIPGSSNWQKVFEAAEEHLAEIEKVYVIREGDQAGQKLVEKMLESPLKERLHIMTIPDPTVDDGQGPAEGEDPAEESVLDPSELWLAVDADKKRFKEVLTEAVKQAKTAKDLLAEERQANLLEAWYECQDLAEEANLLDRFARDLHGAGVVGEDKIVKLLYLASTSRLLDRPISVVVKGPSAGGKSYITKSVLDFFPGRAYYDLTSMSDQALIYSEEPISHRHLILYEGGMESETVEYYLRSLLSEGELKRDVTEKDPETGGYKVRQVRREGPTGFITTTTRFSLHTENETRYLSLNVNDTPEQTSRIMDAIADDHKVEEWRFKSWRALQSWIEVAGVHDVVVPYAKVLSAHVPPAAVRMRRDFKMLVDLIKAHAMLHQATRIRDDTGRILATIDDYRGVYDLVADSMAQAVDKTVSETIRQTVRAVRKIYLDNDENPVTIRQVMKSLKLDRSAVSRRLSAATKEDFLKVVGDDSNKSGKAKKYAIGEPIPENLPVLPTPEELQEGVERVQGCEEPACTLKTPFKCEKSKRCAGVHPLRREPEKKTLISKPKAPPPVEIGPSAPLPENTLEHPLDCECKECM